MSLFHAVAFVDHHRAEVLQFDAAETQRLDVQEHRHFTRQHKSGGRSEHEFYAEVCDAFDGIAEVLVTGGHHSLKDFRHYVEKHRPMTASHIVAYGVVDHPTENQLVALARKQFVAIDRMLGDHVPT